MQYAGVWSKLKVSSTGDKHSKQENKKGKIASGAAAAARNTCMSQRGDKQPTETSVCVLSLFLRIPFL